jgi:transposase
VQAFLLKGSRSARDVSREFGISHSTLYEWVAVAGFESKDAIQPETPDAWSKARRMHAITVFDVLQDEERGEFLRSNGLSTSNIDRWRQMLYAALEVRDQQKLRFEKRIRELEQDLNRKEKALAEASALLLLQKKIRRLLGSKAPLESTQD